MFQTLRTLLHSEPPSEALFTDLWKSIDPTHPLQKHTLEYIQNHLSQWPAHILRTMPEPWLSDSLLTTPKLPPLPIFNSLSLEEPTTEHLQTLHSPHLSNLHTLHIHKPQEPTTTFLNTLLQSFPEQHTLHRLILQRLNIPPKTLLSLTHSPHLSNLQALSLQLHSFTSKHLDALTSSPNLSNLYTLHLPRTCNLRKLSPIANSPHLSRLHSIELPKIPLSHDTLQTIADSPHLPNPQALFLNLSSLNSKTSHLLATHPSFQHLRSLHLAGNPDLTTDDITTLLSSPNLSNLQHLDCSNLPNLNTSHTHLIAQLKHLTHLSFTLLDHLPPQAIETITSSHHIQHLQLNLQKLPPTSKALQLNLPHLRTLSLENISPAHLQTLLSSPLPHTLRHLSIAFSNTFHSPNLTHSFFHSPQLTNLRTIQLHYCHLTDTHAPTIASSPSLPSLTHLDLYGNQMTSKGIQKLAKSHNLSNLHTLNISRNRLKPASVAKLKTLNPAITWRFQPSITPNPFDPSYIFTPFGLPINPTTSQ